MRPPCRCPSRRCQLLPAQPSILHPSRAASRYRAILGVSDGNLPIQFSGSHVDGSERSQTGPESSAELKGTKSCRLSAKDIAAGIKAGGGKYEMTTVEGGKLTATMSGRKIMLTDEKEDMATITTSNVYQSNGVIDVIDTVLMPS
jgi:hypothetical protein